MAEHHATRGDHRREAASFNSYRVDEPDIYRPATTRLESAEYDFRKAVAARRGEGPPPLAYYLPK